VGELWRNSAVELAAMIRGRNVSSREVVQAHLDRVEAVNPHLNAIVGLLPDQALTAADAADQAVADGAGLGRCMASRSRSRRTSTWRPPRPPGGSRPWRRRSPRSTPHKWNGCARPAGRSCAGFAWGACPCQLRDCVRVTAVQVAGATVSHH
jgi:hypothetical protein